MKRMTPGAAIAMGVGLGAALASSMGAVGWATGLAAGAILWFGAIKAKRR